MFIEQAIRLFEKGKIDVSDLRDVSSHINAEIDGKAQNMASIEDIEKIVNENKLIPPFNATTAIVEEVYNIQDLIPREEREALPYKEVMTYRKKEIREHRNAKYILNLMLINILVLILHMLLMDWSLLFWGKV